MEVPERMSSVARCSLNNQISYCYREFMLSCHLCDFSYFIMQFNGAHSFLGGRDQNKDKSRLALDKSASGTYVTF